ncbi:hypothetical protein Ddye_004425 [Dipteronia dyeriana]|uniref:Uncharacterized protein n=1 Tax=Dipteronia dyeriana TaxID=168575 RepID=A0AAD9XU59_9ROSI|nr:hypothetical protein Ddye_004425 [Dipteronia dyeriana]
MNFYGQHAYDEERETIHVFTMQLADLSQQIEGMISMTPRRKQRVCKICGMVCHDLWGSHLRGEFPEYVEKHTQALNSYNMRPMHEPFENSYNSWPINESYGNSHSQWSSYEPYDNTYNPDWRNRQDFSNMPTRDNFFQDLIARKRKFETLEFG